MVDFQYDGQTSFRSGQDWNDTARRKRDGYLAGVNVRPYRDDLYPRYGYEHCQVEIDPNISVNNFVTPLDLFNRGKFQALVPYNYANSSYLLIIISGQLFRFDPSVRCLELVNQTDTPLNELARRINWTQAENNIIFFDGGLPVIYDGTEARRSRLNNPETFFDSANNEFIVNNNPEIPVTCLGTYNQLRLFVGNANQFIAGDPTGGGLSGTGPISFFESLNINGDFNGQSFQLGTGNSGADITAMGHLNVLDNSTGIGPLFLATENQIYSFSSDLPRSAWSTQAQITLLLPNAGIAGQRAWDNINSDLIFVDKDGFIRSLFISRDEQRRWENTAIDAEIDNWREDCFSDLHHIAVVERHKNNVYITRRPYHTKAISSTGDEVTDYANCGLVVLSLDNESGLSDDPRPIWNGLDTGLNPMDMASLDDHMYIISKDCDGINRIYRVNEEHDYDYFKGKAKRIRSRVYLGNYDFESRFSDKSLKNLDLSIHAIKGKFDLIVEYKNAQSEKWFEWGRFEHMAAVCLKGCSTGKIKALCPHSFQELAFKAPKEESCNQATGKTDRSLRSLDIRITLQGLWCLRDVRVKSELIPDDDKSNTCTTRKNIEIEADCDDLFDYELWEIAACPDELKEDYVCYDSTLS